MRLQEYYECPDPAIRNRVFTHAEFMDSYARRHGNFTYCLDWAGFNVPGHVVTEFFRQFKDLSTREQMLQKIVSKFKEKYYIIATYSGPKNYLRHEMAHALYYLSDEYRQRMNELLATCTIKKYLYRWLKQRGYNEDQFDDEIQAYLSTSTKACLQRKINKSFSWEQVAQYHKILGYFLKN
jgi:hypothetical protein